MFRAGSPAWVARSRHTGLPFGAGKEVSQLVNDESRKRRAPVRRKISRRGQRAKQPQRTEQVEKAEQAMQTARPQPKKVAPPEHVARAS